MGVYWDLVDHDKKEYIHLGKRLNSSDSLGGVRFQMEPARIVRFITSRDSMTSLVLIADYSEDDTDYDAYKEVDAWWLDDDGNDPDEPKKEGAQ
jgi:hypothetical protein